MIGFLSFFLLFTVKSSCESLIAVNDIQFEIDEDCLYEGYILQLDKEYITYEWESLEFPNEDLGSDNSIQLNFSSTFCVTVTNDQGVSCNACVLIELIEYPDLNISDGIVCSEDIGVGPTMLNFNDQIISGALDGIWTDDDSSGVDISNPASVDFAGVPIGTYQFTYIIPVGTNCGFILTSVLYVDVVECACPTLVLNPLGQFCNENQLDLQSFINENGEWSSEDLEIINGILYLQQYLPGVYDLTFNWLDISPVCPNMFDTTIEIIGCFQSEQVLSVDVSEDQLVFSWTDELDVLDIDIQVLQGPEGMRDGNTYTMSGMTLGEEGGIEIFVNTEGYQYDNDLIIYGTTANTTSINWLEDSGNLLSVFPNPVDDRLQLELSSINSPIKSIEIYTAAGILLSNDIKPLSNEINVSGLSSGFYFLVLNLGNEKFQLPFIKN